MAPKGGPGSAIFFHGTLVHGSPPNMSPWDRQIIYVTYNAVSNAIRRFKRPAYIAHRDFTPIDAWEDDAVLRAARRKAGGGIATRTGGTTMSLHGMLLARAADRQSAAHRRDRRRQVRLDVSVADPDHARASIC